MSKQRIDKSFTDGSGDGVYSRKPGEKAAAISASRALARKKKNKNKQVKISRTSGALSLYEDWMEPGSGASRGGDRDLSGLGQDQVHVDHTKKVPSPNKKKPTGKYRFDSTYLTEVASSDEEDKKPEPKKEEPKKPPTPPPPPREPTPPPAEPTPPPRPPPEQPRRRRRSPKPKPKPQPPRPPSDPYETDEEKQRDEYMKWIVNGQEDFNKSKKLLFEDKYRVPKKR